MQTLFNISISGVPSGKLPKLVEFLNQINCDGYKLKPQHGEKKKPHYKVPRTFKKSTPEERERMYKLFTIDKLSPELIATETGFSVPTVMRYIKKRD